MHKAALAVIVAGHVRDCRDGKVAADHIGYGEGMIPVLVAELNKLLAQKPGEGPAVSSGS